MWYNLTENLQFLHIFLKISFFHIVAYPGYAIFTTLTWLATSEAIAVTCSFDPSAIDLFLNVAPTVIDLLERARRWRPLVSVISA